MILDAPRRPLRPAEVPDPEPGPRQIVIRVRVCAVCRTDLHVVDGELPDAKLLLVVGHQIVGTVETGGERFDAGTRVGVPWLGWTDGTCAYCRSGRENLCDAARFTGYQLEKVNSIMFCEADQNYTKIFINRGEIILVSKPISYLEEILPKDLFFRIHKSHLVNLNYIKSYNRTEGFQVTLDDGTTLDVATRRNQDFLKALTGK